MAEGLHVLVIMGWVVFWCIAIIVALYVLYFVGLMVFLVLSEWKPGRIERGVLGLLVMVAAWLFWVHFIERRPLFGMPH